jgi:hypothetical protein
VLSSAVIVIVALPTTIATKVKSARTRHSLLNLTRHAPEEDSEPITI